MRILIALFTPFALATPVWAADSSRKTRQNPRPGYHSRAPRASSEQHELEWVCRYWPKGVRHGRKGVLGCTVDCRTVPIDEPVLVVLGGERWLFVQYGRADRNRFRFSEWRGGILCLV